jgi:hypothetical protein
MNISASVLIIYIIGALIIGFLFYLLIEKPRQKIQIYNENPPPQQFQSHWWGYGWRPWWRRYGGIPGVGPAKPLPEPKMPKPLKPVIIPNAP